MWTDTSSKEIHRWQIQTWKGAHIPSLGNRGLKEQWDTPTYLLEWENPTHWQHWMLPGMWNNRNSHTLLMGMKNGAVTLEDSLAISYKTKNTLTMQSNNHLPWYLPKGVTNMSTCFVHTKTCTWMFKAVLFIIIQTGKQLRYSSVGEQINSVTSRWWNGIQH